MPQVREVYESAIEAEEPHNLSDEDTKKLCLKYAALERKLGEVDRARAIFVHASQFSDPRSDRAFWTEWNQFEVQHGNEDTFREMLRIKRSVAASFSMVHMPGAAGGAKVDQGGEGEEAGDMGGKRKREASRAGPRGSPASSCREAPTRCAWDAGRDGGPGEGRDAWPGPAQWHDASGLCQCWCCQSEQDRPGGSDRRGGGREGR